MSQSARGLKTSGGSYQTGYGPGKKLIELAKHSLSDHSPKGVLGLSIIHSLGHKLHSRKPITSLVDRKAHDHILSYLKKFNPKSTRKHVLDFIKSHEHKPLHISDLFGSNHRSKAKVLNDVITKQEGGSFWKKLKGSVKKAGHKLSQFVQGKTKYKPHMLAHHLSLVAKTLSTVTALIPDPRAKALTMGLKTASKLLDPASKALKKHGRGALPKYMSDYIKLNPQQVHRLLKASQNGTGNPIGTCRSKTAMQYFKKNPARLHKIYQMLKSSKLPMEDLDMDGDGLDVSGGALYTAGVHKPYRRCRKGTGPKKVGSRAQVMRGNAKVSYRGETAEELYKNKHGRIVLKNRSAVAKKSYEKNKSNLKPYTKK